MSADIGSVPAGAYDWLIPPPPSTRIERFTSTLQRWGRRLHWRIMLVLLVLAAPFAYALLVGDRPAPPPRPAAGARPDAVPTIASPFSRESLRPLSAKDAQVWNEATPLTATINPPAPAFLLPLADMTDYQRSVQCMTMAVYYEAGNETTDGERAVAQVILNRLRHPVYPKTVCGVIFEGSTRRTGCQFTFACDGSMMRTPNPASWRRAELVAAAALAGYVFEPVGMATHYHANYVVPYWAATLDKVATLGAHIFYRWSGRWGQPAAFTGRYAGKEPSLAFLDAAGPPTDALALPVTPVIVKQDDRPVIAAGGEIAKGAQAGTKPQAVSLQQRWIVPRDDGLATPTPPHDEVPRLAFQPVAP